ncbi:extracellular solute-binding protein [Actinoallomurus purpureus]|uniref:extracellular solute-binding protein n=1 Tax=Actinoallomurus purpureus TaxID=478114 RepID=UPI002092F3CB|nr:extracellular solute-binding protein [Actinoallomurus purpureus]MCO6008652.1 extracellular solute-binding protein [Actinoallomurus purpureus]
MDTAQPLPAYYRLKRRLLADIERGEYGVDGRLPTEHDLCAAYGLSRTPVARALSELAAEGVVIRHRRRGTFVDPEWMRALSAAPEVSVITCDQAWEDQLREAAGNDLRLSITSAPLSELREVFRRAIAEGRGPDLALVDSVWVAEFAESHMLTPIGELDPEWAAAEHDADFLSPFGDAYRLEGDDIVAVQADADVTGLWYRREALEAVGASPPATWRELRALGRTLAEGLPRERHALVMPGGPAATETATYALVGLLAANGATIFTPEAVTLDSPATVETLRFLRRLVDDGVLPAEVVTYERHKAARLLAAGRADLFVGASYHAELLAAEIGGTLPEVAERFGFVPLPAGPHGPPAILCGGMVYCIPRQARNPQLAMRLLRAATAPKRLADLCAETGQLPPRRSVLDAMAPVSPFHAQTAALLEHAVVRPSSPVYALVSAQLQVLLEGVLTRRWSPAAGVALAADRISAITGLPVTRL